MSDITEAREALVERILRGDGTAPPAQRRAAFDSGALPGPLQTLIDKVVTHAYKVTDADITAVTTAGTSEDEIFELVVCAAIGEASRQYETALAALEAAAQGSDHATGDTR